MLILVLDLLGAFGRGFLANGHRRTPDGVLDVRYEHIERYSTPSILRIHFGPTAIQNGKIPLYVSQSVVNELGNQRIIPQPESSILQAGGILYTFPASAAGGIAFTLEPSRPGIFHFTLQVPGSEAFHARVLVFP